MTERPEAFDWGTYLDLAAALVELPIAEEHREAVVAQLKLNHEMARALLVFVMPEGTDLAPVFRP